MPSGSIWLNERVRKKKKILLVLTFHDTMENMENYTSFFLFFFPKPFSFLEIHRSKEACEFFPQAALKRKEMFFFFVLNKMLTYTRPRLQRCDSRG